VTDLAAVPASRRRPPPPAFVWLASQSPRRAALLATLGVPHRLLLADDTEDAEALEAVRPGEAPAAYVRRVTAAKLGAACARLRARGLEPAPILAADTTVAIGRTILGKPADAAEAASMLAALAGRTHRVLTAVAVHDGRRTHAALCVSQVRFGALPRAVVRAYVASGEPFGKAGAYAIQGPIAAHVERIAGSHSGIVGLPLFETRQLLERAGWRAPVPPAASDAGSATARR
jgi:septum formation protein